MSWDVSIEATMLCPHCEGGGPITMSMDHVNVTWNVSPMIDAILTGIPWIECAEDDERGKTFAGGSFRRSEEAKKAYPGEYEWGTQLLRGKTGKEAQAFLISGVQRMNDPDWRKYLRKMNAPNGWGTFDTTRKAVERMLEMAREYPDGVFSVT